MGIISRHQKLSNKHSFFLFGARGTGKTTLLKQLFSQNHSRKTSTLWINLLSFTEERRFSQNPDLLSEILDSENYQRIIIDEIQKIPKLLDIVHLEIEKNKKRQFILTGSSARKLKRGAANLLAGRLFTFSLYPLTHIELKSSFNLNHALQMGTLPGLLNFSQKKNQIRYLNSYVETYLKEEVFIEQLVRKINPFRNFLEIASQTNGEIVNFSKIARDVGVEHTTVKTYFDIIVDTHLGFYLNSFDRSIRKQQNQAPKFFLFDHGVKRVLSGESETPLRKGSYSYGKAFEHFVILELLRLNSYYEKNLKVSYLRDKDNNEIDLVIQFPNKKELIIEIKSTEESNREHEKNLVKFTKIWDRPCMAQVWSNDSKNRKIGSIQHYHWQTGIKKVFETK